MSTRSLTTFHNGLPEDENSEIVVMYRQMDGYPSGHGEDLKRFFTGEDTDGRNLYLVNGISMAETRRIANGMDCLAAQVVKHFKDGPGNIYLYRAGTRDCGEEYTYAIYCDKESNIKMRVYAGCMTFFGLPGTKQKNMNILYDGLVYDFDAEKVMNKRRKNNESRSKEVFSSED